jgi:hypothetical protein
MKQEVVRWSAVVSHISPTPRISCRARLLRAHEVAEPTKLHRKSGIWGTRGSWQMQAFRLELIAPSELT